MKHALSTLAMLAIAVFAVGQESVHVGLFSSTATSIWARADAFTIMAADKSKAIEVAPIPDAKGDASSAVTVRAYGREYKTQIGAWVNAEAAWASDSKAFFVTYSDGGNVGAYHVKVFYVEASGLRVVEPVPNGRRLFAPTCFDTEFPNVAAIRWGTDSSRLIVAVEVPPHSSCASMGTFRAFEIGLPHGEALRRYGQLEAKKQFSSSIGSELQNADDNCIRRPKACNPSGW